MPVERHSGGRVFNAVADEYDRHRPPYPDELVDGALQAGGLRAGDRVLEIGCGTGQLTRSLIARGLKVTAVEPGERLIERARDRLARADVRFIHARLEEASVEPGTFRAAFAASAIHWIDPDVGWSRLAGALAADGSVALLSHFGLEDPWSRDDQKAFRAALARIAPEPAGEWPSYRDLDTLRSGAARRRDNVSEVWAWLGAYDVARGYVAGLFGTARLAVLPTRTERTAEQVGALLGTMSFWPRLSPGERDSLAGAIRSLERRLGRPLRSTTAACLVTARRTGTG